MVITAVVALLDFKIPLLWSESRILRKLRRRRRLEDVSLRLNTPKERVAPSPLGPRPYVSPERKFEIAYATIGKGRHTRASRLFIPALEVWGMAIEIIQFSAGQLNWPLSSKLTTFEPLLAFRLKIFLSSFTVLGAWPTLRRLQHGIFALLAFAAVASVYVEMMYLIGLRFIHVPNSLRICCQFASATTFGILVLMEILEALLGDDIANVCAHMLCRNGSAAAESIVAKRFEDVQRQVVNKLPHRRFSRRQYLRIVLCATFYVTLLLSQRSYSWDEKEVTKELCNELVIDMVLTFLELLYTFLWIIQDSEVEPEVFRLLVTQEMRDA